MHNLIISPAMLDKLASKHGVSRKEVEQCFDNRTRGIVEDTRADHKTNPPSWWFLAPTDRGRILKVVFVIREGDIFLKTAFQPDDAAAVLALYLDLLRSNVKENK